MVRKTVEDIEGLEPFQKLSRDLKSAAATMTSDEARYLVDAYYTVQDWRIRFGNQIRALSTSGEPHELLIWMAENAKGLEKNIQGALDVYSNSHEVGVWARTVPGIGPVLASGLLAHIDITKAPTVGHIWSYGGYNPEAVWNKGEKRPWNAELKRLLYLIGESFIKVQNNERDLYGHIFAERMSLELRKNNMQVAYTANEKGELIKKYEAILPGAPGQFAEQAQAILEKKNFRKTTDAYKWYSQGMLPPAHIHARARRYAVKLFLSHLHHVWYQIEFGTPPPKPYILTQPPHSHFIAPPNWS